MLEKRNMTGEVAEKDAAGDAGVLDDIVDLAAGKMGRAGAPDPRRRERELANRAAGHADVTGPITAVC